MPRTNRSLHAAALACCLAMGANAAEPCAEALTVYAVGQLGFDNERLFKIDAATGAILSQTQLTGIVDTQAPRALEFTPGGRLLAFTQLNDNRLYEIDPATAAATEIGQFNAPLFEAGLAIIDETTAYVANVNVSSLNFLGLVDISDATFDQDIRPSYDTFNLDLSGLALRSDGMLVGFDSFGREVPERLVEVNPQTGVVTPITDIESLLNGDTAGMTIHNGVGYYIYNPQSSNPLIDPRDPEIWSFDPFTGAQTFLSRVNTDYQFHGLEIEPCDAGCAADLAEPFGELNIFDVLAFLDQFDAGDPEADLAEPAGSFDIFDALAYLAEFDAGC